MLGKDDYKSVSILGCGWLGLPLGEYLVEKGYKVKGSVTSREKFPLLEKAGIEPYEIRLVPQPEGDSLTDFLDADVLVVCIPPRFRKYQIVTRHADQIKFIKEAVSKVPLDKVIYTSSTSVYPNENGVVNENSDLSHAENAKVVSLAEEQLRIDTPFDTTILRCGGLMGYDRMLIKYVQGKQIDNGDLPVNYVHRDDVIGIIEYVIKSKSFNTVLNAVSPEHPTRKELCEKQHKVYGFDMPIFIEGKNKPSHKVVSSQKLTTRGYLFRYPDPMDYLYDIFAD